ncbi:MAG: response regulator transcription factor [Hyphomonadaceae bacterium]|nr:response regulator transcription factor [Hyphomonadaceae bacterium]
MNRKTTILIVDDDPDLREELVDQLNGQDDLRATGVGVGHEGMAAAMDGKAGLILLDVSLPDGDGRALCRAMRAAGVRTPIVMLTGESDDAITIDALEAGANDYVTKPFKFNVLLARIRAHLRNHESSEDAVFRIGPYEFRPAVKTLLDPHGKRVRLTEKETSILKYLYRAGSKPVPRDELLREVWGYNSGVTTHTLETHIYRLRQKFEPEANSPQLLITETGGYRLQP